MKLFSKYKELVEHQTLINISKLITFVSGHYFINVLFIWWRIFRFSVDAQHCVFLYIYLEHIFARFYLLKRL